MAEDIRVETTPEQLDAAFSGPAPNSNRYVVSQGSQGIRIAFLEDSAAGKSYFRSAVNLSHLDAMKLYKLIQDMMKDIEPKLLAAIKTVEKAENQDG